MQPLISIIIPTYNRAHLLGETLDSVIAQTYKNWECVVVDDGSIDYTKELLEFYIDKDSRISYHLRPIYKKKGANSCRNYGFELSKGEYINWFDDDDLMHAEKLELQEDALSKGAFEFCICKTVTFVGFRENMKGLRFNKQISPSPFQDYIEMKIGWMTPSVLWKKKLLKTLKYLFDENLKAAQEWEFHSRVLAHYQNYQSLEEKLDFIRRHNNSITYRDNEEERLWNYFLARLKIYQNEDLKIVERTENFLRNYLLNVFKMMIRTQNPFAIKAFTQFIIPESNMNLQSKFYALLAILSYKLVGKGNNIHQKIKYKE